MLAVSAVSTTRADKFSMVLNYRFRSPTNPILLHPHSSSGVDVDSERIRSCYIQVHQYLYLYKYPLSIDRVQQLQWELQTKKT